MKTAVYFEHILTTLAVGVSALTFTGCDNHDFDFEDAKSENLEYQFKKTFTELYGEIDPEETWDFSINSYNDAGFSTRALAAADYTISVSDNDEYHDNGEYYGVQDATLSYMINILSESNNHKSLGNPFGMEVPNNPNYNFTLIPIYQGQAGLQWDLHLVVQKEGQEPVDTKIWEKSQGIQIATTNRQGKVTWTTLNKSQNTLGAENGTVRAKPITVSGAPAGADMYFYLEITYATGNTQFATVGTKQKSTDGMIKSFPCPIPTNIPKGRTAEGREVDREVLILGCEDANKAASDWDYNDIVFILIGEPNAPEKIEYQKKRYMVEDLGYATTEADKKSLGVDDIDFNDIVVDFVRSRRVSYSGGAEVPGSWSNTEVTVRALGGVLDFSLQVGDETIFTKSTTTTGINTAYEYKMPNGESVNLSAEDGFDPGTMYNTGRAYNKNGDDVKDTDEWLAKLTTNKWNPATNNIKFILGAKQSNGVYNNMEREIVMPTKGAIPQIIAFPLSKVWQNERVAITRDWVGQHEVSETN